MKITKSEYNLLKRNEDIVEFLKSNRVQLGFLNTLEKMILEILAKLDQTYLVKEKTFITEQCYEIDDEQSVYRVLSTFSLKNFVPLTQKWEYFDISEDLTIEIGTSKYPGVSDALLLSDDIKAYGGTQYIEPVSRRTSAFVGSPYVGFKNGNFVKAVGENDKDTLPVFPYRIKFLMNI